MTTRDDASALVQRTQECFNTRRFDEADDLFTPGYFSHALGTTGWRGQKPRRRSCLGSRCQSSATFTCRSR